MYTLDPVWWDQPARRPHAAPSKAVAAPAAGRLVEASLLCARILGDGTAVEVSVPTKEAL